MIFNSTYTDPEKDLEVDKIIGKKFNLIESIQCNEVNPINPIQAIQFKPMKSIYIKYIQSNLS